MPKLRHQKLKDQNEYRPVVSLGQSSRKGVYAVRNIRSRPINRSRSQDLCAKQASIIKILPIIDKKDI